MREAARRRTGHDPRTIEADGKFALQFFTFPNPEEKDELRAVVIMPSEPFMEAMRHGDPVVISTSHARNLLNLLFLALLQAEEDVRLVGYAAADVDKEADA